MIAPFSGYIAAGAEPDGSGSADARALRGWATRLDRAPAGRPYHSLRVLTDAVAAAALRRLDPPSLMRYEVREADRSVVGVVGVVDAADPAAPLLPHEETRPEETSFRRLARVRAAADTRPIVLASPVPLPSLESAGAEVVIRRGSASHRISRLSASSAAAVVDALASSPLVIADGHHRARVAREHSGDSAASILAWVVPARSLRAGAFHRCFERFAPPPDRLAGSFDIRIDTVTANPESVTAGSILWWPDPEIGPPLRLTPRPDAVAGLAPEAAVSMAAVARHALWPMIGVEERDAVYVGDVGDAISCVGPGGAVALLPGMEPSEVVAAAMAGVLLPPKATRFSPKPVRGALVRPL
jgi:hypothetical protein